MEAGDGYAAVAEAYDAGYEGPYWDLYDEVTRHVASRILPASPARVLDAGAGTGKFSLWLLGRGHHVTLLDPSEAMLAKARRKIEAAGLLARAEFVVGGLPSMGVPEGAFDAVFCEGDPLSYCVDTYGVAARDLVRALAPGGGFYVSCDSRAFTAAIHLAAGDAAGAVEVWETGRTRDRYGIPVRAFLPHELVAAFEAAGAVDVTARGKIVLSGFLDAKNLEGALADERLRERFVRMETEAMDDPSLAALGGHVHVTGRRPRA